MYVVNVITMLINVTLTLVSVSVWITLLVMIAQGVKMVSMVTLPLVQKTNVNHVLVLLVTSVSRLVPRLNVYVQRDIKVRGHHVVSYLCRSLQKKFLSFFKCSIS